MSKRLTNLQRIGLLLTALLATGAVILIRIAGGGQAGEVADMVLHDSADVKVLRDVKDVKDVKEFKAGEVGSRDFLEEDF